MLIIGISGCLLIAGCSNPETEAKKAILEKIAETKP
jgi:hypothetical protein